MVANGVEHTAKEAIETAIMQVNEAKYRASEDTPSQMIRPLIPLAVLPQPTFL